MLIDDEENGGATWLELNCSRYQLQAASISHSADGTVFRCSCGPLSDDRVAAVHRAARDGTPVWLVFPESQVVIADVSVELAQPGWVQLEGRVVTVPNAMGSESRDGPHAGS